MAVFMNLTPQTKLSKEDFIKYYEQTFHSKDKAESVFNFLNKDQSGDGLDISELSVISGADNDANSLSSDDMHDAIAVYASGNWKGSSDKIENYLPDVVKNSITNDAMNARTLIRNLFSLIVPPSAPAEPEFVVKDIMELDLNDPKLEWKLGKIGIPQKEIDALLEAKRDGKITNPKFYAAKAKANGGDQKHHIYTTYVGETQAGGKNAPYGSSTYTSLVPLERGFNKLLDYKEVNPDKYHTVSPLVIDMDGDGIEAQAGVGIDIDGNGTADGAAVGDDRMLGVDLNGDGKITGEETFGNYTVDPYTGKKLQITDSITGELRDIKNGFEALQAFALSVQARYEKDHPGQKLVIFDEVSGKVDMEALNKGLAATGENQVGFTHYDAATGQNIFENLHGIKTIDVKHYADHTAENADKDVQENQVGSGEDANGNDYNVTDVWFKTPFSSKAVS